MNEDTQTLEGATPSSPAQTGSTSQPNAQGTTQGIRPFRHADPEVEKQVRSYVQSELYRSQQANGQQGSLAQADMDELNRFRQEREQAELDKAKKSGDFESIVGKQKETIERLQAEAVETQVGNAVADMLKANNAVDAAKTRALMNLEVDFRPGISGIAVYEKGTDKLVLDQNGSPVSLAQFGVDWLNRNEFMKNPAVPGNGTLQSNVGNNSQGVNTKDDVIDFDKFSAEAMLASDELRDEYNALVSRKLAK